MQLMSEFYGSAQLVPYDGKQVSNFRSTIHKTEKFKDMQETLDYFRALKEEDPEFFYKIKLDDNHRVENLFWVDSAARRAYKEELQVAYHDKFSGTIGPILAKNDELNEEFVDCLNHTVSPEDFESKWATMVQKYGLEDNEHFQHLYHIRQSFIPAYYMHSFFPFLQSTQRSEGFNALLKKFSKEFEKTAEYDVKPVGQFQYWLEPNNSFVFRYGKRNYLVTAIEEDESYCCECSKFDRDGIICCHIMRVMVRMGVKLIPERYILKRWTQQAIASDTNQVQNVNAPVGLVARGMPLTSEKTLRLTNATTAFVAIAVEGCTNDENYAILEKHIKEMRSEFEEIKKRTMANRQNTSGAEGGATEGAQNGTGVSTLSGPSLQTAGAVAGPNTSSVANAPKSKAKGRRKEKAHKKGMNGQAKRKNKCGICKSYDHNA
ncbi:protein FAR-RED IMPAIRED RESPONSE 1-like [Sorghum bicolor]|uniref:protein FAR-RED IMPAIRED RESPONSE 1-like n=1 Tax=Sorghum bicolor TaxID=4558 RepID=UPI000B42519A|nr:protein FAR-RED IMPAIRED RESPONSE 1-like [Sorghum bicolor]|eukprot:XP_021321689.1 protein FAR-RED IMPAIRED RESPONSE 1-like [Sorghum bicolor]